MTDKREDVKMRNFFSPDTGTEKASLGAREGGDIHRGARAPAKASRPEGGSPVGAAARDPQKQVDGFQSLMAGLATSHTHQPFPNLGQGEVWHNPFFGQHLLQNLEPCPAPVKQRYVKHYRLLEF